MKIGRIKVSVHKVPVVLPLLEKPTGDGLRVLCEVETEDGLVGQGMTGKFLGHGVAAIVEHYLAPAVQGMDPRDLEAIHARLMPLVSERGHMSGINLSALACLDLALWDLIGKAAGRSVAQLLGGHNDHADVYVTFGFGAYDRDQLVDVARGLIAKGHKRLKILVGVSPEGPRGDADRVRHVRDAIGEDILLAMDANESVTLDVATDIARRVEEFDIAWFEDPVKNNDPRDLAMLRLSAGQMDGHSQRFRSWLEHDALDIFMPNSMYNGGMTETRRVAHLAAIYNRPLSDAGGGGIYCLHHVAGFSHGTLAEMHLGIEKVEEALFIDPPQPVDGRLAVPTAPGFGVTLNSDRLKETRIKP